MNGGRLRREAFLRKRLQAHLSERGWAQRLACWGVIRRDERLAAERKRTGLATRTPSAA